MANGVRGEMTCQLAGTELVLVPSFRRIAKVETALGRSLVEISNELARGRGMSFTELVTFIDIVAREPKPSREDIGDTLARHGLKAGLKVLSVFLERMLLGEDAADGAGGNDEGSSSAE